MKKKTIILAASVVVILALLATVFFLLARNADPSAGAEAPVTNIATENLIFTQPVKEQEVNPPTGEPNQGTTDEEPEPEAPALNENGKIPISSPATLTDETTGKGIISLGDSVEQVKEALLKYEPTEGYKEIAHEETGKYGTYFMFGDTIYRFDPWGWLLLYEDHLGTLEDPGSFETSRGLRIGDPISKVFELYGKDYSFSTWPWGPVDFKYDIDGVFLNVRTGTLDIREDGVHEEDDEDLLVRSVICSRVPYNDVIVFLEEMAKVKENEDSQA